MPVTSAELWKLLRQSRLLPPERLEQVRIALDQAGLRTGQLPARSLAQWLLRQHLLTQYQAKVLLSGRAGPFLYGDYQVRDRVRGGRLAGAFHAVHLPSRHAVLLRFVDSRVAQDPRLWHVARQHVRAVSPVVHDQLQRVFALEDLTGYRFLVLEWLDGTSLDLRMNVAPPMPAAEACRIARLAAMGLAELHARRQVYGDVRPRNMWIDGSNNVKLLRDGIQPPSVPELSQPGLTSAQLAQADYMAPELSHPGTLLGPVTDVYALGCTLYEMLSGRVPFAGGSPQDKLRRHATAPLAPLPPLRVPRELAGLVFDMLAKDPAKRIASASLIARQLAPFLAAADLAVPVAPVTATLREFEEIVGQSRSLPPAPPPLLTEPDEHPPIAAPPIESEMPAPAAREPDTQEMPPSVVTQPTPPSPSGMDILSLPPRRQSILLLRKTREVRRKRAMLLSVLALLLIAAASAVLLNSQLREALLGRPQAANPATPSPRDRTVAGPRNTEPSTPDNDPMDPLQRYSVRSDDGQLPWMSPTGGSPLQLKWVPPGAQLILAVRPHDLHASPSGEQVWQALGPGIGAARKSWETAAGLPLEQVAQLVLTLHDAQPRPEAFLRIRLQHPHTPETLLAAWGNPPPTDYQGQQYYETRGWTFFIPDTSNVNGFVMGSTQQIREVIDRKDAPVILRRELSRLAQHSDRDRHLSLLFVPDFVVRKLLVPRQDGSPEDRQRLRQAVDWLLREDTTACLLSWQLADPFYLELRAVGQANQDSHAIAQSLRDRVAEIPDRVEQLLGRIYPAIYWRRIALRLPTMVRFLQRYTRVGVENDQAIANAALPAEAAHNLAFAAGMLLHARADALGESSGDPPASRIPRTLEELVERPASLRFDQKSLEIALRDLEVEIRDSYPNLPFPFEIQLLGNDLQSEGITRNQQIGDFQVENKPLGEVLTALVLRANPVTTVTRASEADQKLVWVVGRDPTDPNKQVLLITTREAAKRNGYNLPSSFLPE